MSLLCGEQDKKSDPICQECPWFDGDFVVASWRSSPIAIVCEMPTTEDYIESELFSGLSGELVGDWLSDFGLRLSKVSLLSTVKCSEGKDKPSKDVLFHCKSHLISDLDYIGGRGLKVVVPLGVTATRGFFPVSKFSDIRGVVKQVEFGSYKLNILPTLSPSHILSQRGQVEVVKKDFSTVSRFSRGLSLSEFLGESVTDCEVVRTKESVKQFLCLELPKHEVISIDIETTGYDVALDKQTGSPLNFLSGDLLTINFSYEQGKGVILPLLGFKAKKIWTDNFKGEIFKWLRYLLHSSDILWILHNAAFDLKFLSYLVGIDVSKVRFADTMLMAHLLWEESPKDLKSLAHVYTNLPNWSSQIRD